MNRQRPKLRQGLHQQGDEPRWATSVVERVSLDDVWLFAESWLDLEAQGHRLEIARHALFEHWNAQGLPTPSVMEALRHLQACARLETSADVMTACLAVVTCLLKERAA